VSDPGYHLVRAFKEQGLPVVPVPGACALVCALSASGLPTDSFRFSGFLPAKRPARLDCLRELSQEKSTLVFYESPHRIIVMLEDACEVFGGERLATIARELTKQFETILHGSLNALLSQVQADAKQTLGEFVVCIEGYQAPVLSVEDSLTAQEQSWLNELIPHVAPAQLAQIMARQFLQTKKRYYTAISDQKKNHPL
jgi:16S rRNA (cytidine1402-2'-O)-methyltransferase